ncbi:nuclear transport factor 2 family protein [Burkholderiaceae bacterium DAT-1]|nr:nuclear transport factor 2 family protein [Burkholderiaceae bacterium DAT-1]
MSMSESAVQALVLAQAQLDAYNTQNLDAFLACYAEDVIVTRDDGSPPAVGKAAMRERYGKLFKDFPQNRAILLGRVHVGPWVFDSEQVIGRGDQALYVVAQYLVQDGLIRKVNFYSEHPHLPE